MPTCSPRATVLLEPYTQQIEAGEAIVGFPAHGIFIVLQPDAFCILEQLRQGRTLGEAEDLYIQTYGEIPDLDGFVEDLGRRGLLRYAKGVEETAEATATPQRSLASPAARHPFVPSRAARFFFSKSLLAAQFVVIGLAFAAVITDPTILPTRASLFFPHRLALMSAVILLFSFATAFLHEFAHLAAARAAGVEARLGLSHRLWIVVLETDLTGLWAIPRRQRILPLLAGPLVDATSLSLLLLVIRWHGSTHHGLPVQGLQYLKAACMLYILRLLWQCYLFMKTDFYYALTLATRCKNLMKDTEDLLRNQLARLFRRRKAVDQSHLSTSESFVVKVYLVPWLAGRIVALYVLVVIQLPLLWSYFMVVFHRLSSGYHGNPTGFLDSLTLALLGGLSMGAGLYLWIRALFLSWRKPYAVVQ